MSDYDPEIAAALPRLTDGDPAVRRIALRDIADYADDYPELFSLAARDADAGVRLEAALALEGATDDDAIDALVVLLGDDDQEVVAAASTALAEILDPAAAPALLRNLPRVQGEARAAVLAGLRQLRHPDALAPALMALDDALPAVRRAAVGVLAYLKNDAALPALERRIVEDDHPAVRKAAVAALTFAPLGTALPSLLRALKDTDWQVRQEAAITLGRVRPPDATDSLIAALADPSWEVRQKAAAALGAYRVAQAIP
ncbi:MAG TPA: HEAT repeat domain-containing protein, partial [Albitalea sp.]